MQFEEVRLESTECARRAGEVEVVVGEVRRDVGEECRRVKWLREETRQRVDDLDTKWKTLTASHVPHTNTLAATKSNLDRD